MVNPECFIEYDLEKYHFPFCPFAELCIQEHIINCSYYKRYRKFIDEKILISLFEDETVECEELTN